MTLDIMCSCRSGRLIQLYGPCRTALTKMIKGRAASSCVALALAEKQLHERFPCHPLRGSFMPASAPTLLHAQSAAGDGVQPLGEWGAHLLSELVHRDLHHAFGLAMLPNHKRLALPSNSRILGRLCFSKSSRFSAATFSSSIVGLSRQVTSSCTRAPNISENK